MIVQSVSYIIFSIKLVSFTTFRFRHCVFLFWGFFPVIDPLLARSLENMFDPLSFESLSFTKRSVTTERIVIKIVDDSTIDDDEIFVVTLSTTNLNVQIDKSKGATSVTIIVNDG